LGKSISSDSLLVCDVAITKFVIEFEKLYGTEHMSFNVRLLIHLVKAVKDWGSLWATSAFIFESANGRLMKMFHGTRYVTKEIFNNFLAHQNLTT